MTPRRVDPQRCSGREGQPVVSRFLDLIGGTTRHVAGSKATTTSPRPQVSLPPAASRRSPSLRPPRRGRTGRLELSALARQGSGSASRACGEAGSIGAWGRPRRCGQPRRGHRRPGTPGHPGGGRHGRNRAQEVGRPPEWWRRRAPVRTTTAGWKPHRRTCRKASVPSAPAIRAPGRVMEVDLKMHATMMTSEPSIRY